jgi:anti-sigma factor RsiW
MSRSERHLTDEHIQDWLDGRLRASESARTEAHVEACPRCHAEVEEWRALLGELAELGELAPHAGFSGRVLDAVGDAQARRVHSPRAVSLAARVRARLTPPPHPDSIRLQDFADGMLGRRSAAAVRRHLDGCPACRAEAQRWVALVDDVRTLPRLAPSPGFAQAVMRQVRVAPAPAPAQAITRRALDRVRALAGPRHRLAWAAAAGVAFTPVVTVALVAHAVFSHPLVTVGNLAAFAWLQGSELIRAGGGGFLAGLIESASIFRAWSAVGTLSPTAAGAGLLGACALTLASTWVLWRNVVAPAQQVARADR